MGKTWGVSTALLLAANSNRAFASGACDFGGMGAMLYASAFSFFCSFAFLILVCVHKKYTIWSISRFVLFALLVLLTQLAAVSMAVFLWDTVHSRWDNDLAALGLSVAFALVLPAAFVASLGRFSKAVAAKQVWALCLLLTVITAAISALFAIFA